MTITPTYEELEQRVKKLEEQTAERKEAEKALLVSEEELRTFMDTMTDFFAVTDKDENLIYVNKSMAEKLGYSREEMIGMHISRIISEESMVNFVAEVEELVEKGKLSIEATWLTKDGEKIYGEINANAVYDGNGNYAGTRGVFRNITKRRRVEEALRQQRDLAQKYLDIAGSIIVVIGADQKVSVINSRACELLGCEPEEVIGKDWFDNFLPERVREILRGSFMELMSQPGKNIDELFEEGGENPVMTKHGAERTIAWHNAVLKDGKGNVTATVSSGEDVTEIRKAEMALRKAHNDLERRVQERTAELLQINEQLKQEIKDRKQAQERLLRITKAIDNSSDAIGMADPQGHHFYQNKSFTDLFEYATAEELEAAGGAPVAYMDQAVARDVFDTIMAGKSWVGETEMVSKSGCQFPVLLRADAIKDDKENIIGLVGLHTDLTERKRGEEEREKLEAQLQQAQRLESIGTLAGGIAHDFNNILMGIQGYVSMMLLDVDEANPNYERLKSIERQVQRGARLTSHLLGYARKGKYEVRPFSLNQLVEETSYTFGRTRKEVTIHQHLSADAYAIEGDPGQIEQVLLNLFVNAAEAMPDGGNLILKTMNVTDKDMKGKLYKPKHGNYVLLRVIDTGTGMDKKTANRIFEPFFTTKEMGRGTGLGLASAYGIIKAHEGYIDVDSKKDRGTTFSIYLPASEKGVMKSVNASDRIVEGTETVLFVDDEEVIRQASKELLETMGYRVLIAKDGKEATELYKKKQNDIDIVLLDIVMPNMGGREAYDMLKEINPDIKVLLFSGYSIEGQAAEILERGANAFIQKPFNIKELSGKIRDVLDKQ